MIKKEEDELTFKPKTYWGRSTRILGNAAYSPNSSPKKESPHKMKKLNFNELTDENSLGDSMSRRFAEINEIAEQLQTLTTESESLDVQRQLNIDEDAHVFTTEDEHLDIEEEPYLDEDVQADVTQIEIHDVEPAQVMEEDGEAVATENGKNDVDDVEQTQITHQEKIDIVSPQPQSVLNDDI